MPPPEKPRPKPKPKPKLKMGPPEVKKPIPLKPVPEPERVGTPGGLPIVRQPFSCATYPLCPPPPAPPATVHLRSGHLPTPLIVLSASLLAVSALLLIALLVRYLIRRRRRGPQEVPLAPQQSDDEESVLAVDAVVAGGAVGGEEGEEEEVDSGDGGVHHVWYIRTKGLDERAIAAIAAVVYDAKKRGGAVDADGGCAVCLADFRDGETLRLLPRCGHAFHRACIDTWLRAHVNCPLCRAPVVQAAASAGKGAAAAAALAAPGTAADSEAAAPDTRTEEAERRVCPPAARAVRRTASMLTLPRVAWPDVPLQAAPAASNSARGEDMTGLAKIRRLLKFSEVLDVARIGVGRSVSFGAGSLPTRSGPSTATSGVNSGDGLE